MEDAALEVLRAKVSVQDPMGLALRRGGPAHVKAALSVTFECPTRLQNSHSARMRRYRYAFSFYRTAL